MKNFVKAVRGSYLVRKIIVTIPKYVTKRMVERKEMRFFLSTSFLTRELEGIHTGDSKGILEHEAYRKIKPDNTSTKMTTRLEGSNQLSTFNF